jgi:hypothetical protein
VQFLTDTASIGTAAQHRAPGGDDYNLNLYERPFTSQTMDYLPWVDILGAQLAWDGQWFYVSIKLQATPVNAPLTDYDAEIDVNRDGRGEYLIVATSPKTTDWTTDGVRVYQDQDHDVGGAIPVLPDTHPGNGYETLIFNQGQGPDPDAAWARISPSDPATVELAFLPDAIGSSTTFVWWVWADRGIRQPGWFDYNDHFTQAQAGSPLVENKQYYPVAALWGVDNTCRMAYGFTPPANMLGLCTMYAPPAPPGPAATGTPGIILRPYPPFHTPTREPIY